MANNVKPVVFLFQDDYQRVRKWVLEYPDRETGGQMFGLWTHDKKPYVNIIAGPGKNCRHGTHSFHQDIDYLKKIGTFLNSEFMMCHIGEWHSHHKLRLRQPSSGDLNSIWKHFPAGVEYFLLIIATIERDDVRLNPWLFKASTHSHELIDVEVIKKDNVFMLVDEVAKTMRNGAEISKQNTPVDSSSKQKNIECNATEYSVKVDEKWFESHWGIFFANLLNSKLEKIIDGSTNIDKTIDKELGCLRFSLQRNTCHVEVTFPPDFPLSALAVVCRVPEPHHSSYWYVFKEPDQNEEEFVDIIVNGIERNVPRKMNPTAHYAAFVK